MGSPVPEGQGASEVAEETGGPTANPCLGCQEALTRGARGLKLGSRGVG